MTDEPDRMRELRKRMEQLKQETTPSPEPTVAQAPPVQSGSSGRLHATLKLSGLVLSLVMTFQLAFTLMSFNGKDFDDARRVGRATVETCQRRGPIGIIYGYWDECLVSITWNDGVPARAYLDKPHLFRADEVGTTVEIGDNGYGRSGSTYSRPHFKPQPVLATLGIVLFIIAAISAAITLWVLWHLLRGIFAKAFRRS